MSPTKNSKPINPEQYSWMLRKLVPLADLPDRQFEELIEKLSEERGAADTVLFRQGDNKNEFVYLLEGRIELRIDDSPLQSITAGTPDALFALAHQFPRRASAVAVTSVSYVRIASDLLASDPDARHKNSNIHSDPGQTPRCRSISENGNIESILNRSRVGANSATRSDDPTPPDAMSVMKQAGSRINEVPDSGKHRSTTEKSSNSRSGIFFSNIAKGFSRLKSVITRRQKHLRQTPAAGSGSDQKLSVEPVTITKQNPENSVTLPNNSENNSKSSATKNFSLGAIRLKSRKQPGSAGKSADHVQGMVLIPGFALVSLYDSETVLVSAFLLDKTPATNQAYLAFIEDTGARTPDFWGSKGPRKNEFDHPVIGISLDEARKFAEWCGKRLPTGREWEAAARPMGRFRFPWGNNWDPGRCNGPDLGFNKTTPVAQFPAGATPEGCLDMVGNVWEWCERLEVDPDLDPSYSWVYGGSYRHACVNGNVISRTMVLDENRYGYLGFRCAKNLD
ncbi:MAG: SUMF1/EgtB/PvdO family nonheme iron enzyme [Methylococcales bacterium]